MVDRWCRMVFIGLVTFLSLFGFTMEQQVLVSRPERSALLRLRSSLGLRAKEWPIKSDPCTGWVGVQCTNGRVTGINISGFRRTRRGNENPQFSVDALRNLTLLSSFNSSNFLLPGSIPPWLGLQLASLQVLDLSSCSISGAIPSSLGNLSSLVELHLSDNNLTGTVPSSLGQLLRLSVLDLSRNTLTDIIPDSLTTLGNLTSLDMSANSLSGAIPRGIGNMFGLKFLNLSQNNLSSTIPAGIGGLSSLVDLDLGVNTLSGSVPPNLGMLRNLQQMVVRNNLLSGSLPLGLFHPLTQLRIVILSHNNFSGAFPDVLPIPTLQFLDISVNSFTGGLPNVSSTAGSLILGLNISHNLFYGNLPSVFRGLNNMDAMGNYFQGIVPFNLRDSSSLGTNCLQNVSNQRSASECESFYSDRGLVFDKFGSTEGTLSPPDSNRKSHKKAIILAAVGGGVGFIALVVIVITLLILCKRKRRPTSQRAIAVGPVLTSGSPQPPGESLNYSILGDAFTYQQILQATGEFNDSNLIKHGHSGDLFQGILEGGLQIVVKKIDLQSSLARREAHIAAELDLFTKISHPRFVPLLGYCLENENEKFVVYKFMPNQDLASALFKKTKSDDESLQSLDWIIRLKIAIGAAEGLSYLHHECVPPLVHRDIRASSILLDDKFEVRLGSLSEVCAQEVDSHQSRITKLLRMPQTSEQGSSGATANATCAYDIYCFGKVLLELVTGKLGLSSATDSSMKEWLEATLPYISIYDKELVTNIVDTSLLIDDDLLEEVWAMAIIARSCLNPKPSRRPQMRYVLKALENPLKVVREEQHTSSARLRNTSFRGSWNAAIFGSWRQSSSDATAAAAAMTATRKGEGGGSVKQQSGGTTTGSQEGSGNNGRSSSTRRHSNEIFPEPLDDDHDVERFFGNNIAERGPSPRMP